MNKTIILYIVAALMIAAFVSAAGLEIDSVKIYVEDDLVSGADEDGGEIDVMQDDLLEIQVSLDNNINNITDARLKAILYDIDDGDNIEKIREWYEIGPNDGSTKTLSFIIPENADKGYYDLTLTIYYRYKNGTEYHFDEIDYEVRVGQEGSVSDINLMDSFSNLTSTCGNMVSTINSCFGYIEQTDTVKGELSTCKEERGTYKTNFDNCEQDITEKKNENTNIINERDNYKNEADAKQRQIDTMLTNSQCMNITNAKVKEIEKGNTNMMGLLIGGGVLGWWWWNNKKKKASVYDSYYSEKSR